MDPTTGEWKETELEDLLRKARHGSREAMEELLDRTEGIVRSVSKRELFYRVWGPEQSYENARAGLLHFTYHQQEPVAEKTSVALVKTCLSRYLMTMLRRELRRQRHETLMNFNSRRVQHQLERRGNYLDESPEAACVRREIYEQLYRQLTALEERERQILLLHYNSSLSFQEIADQLGCHINTVYKVHRTALQKLRQTLAPLYDR
ncbi:MAG: hypothetical protein ACFWT7_01525 [Succiniclasticum sp.]|jgi:RNA polymerase sigma factor (sigma-70 family)